mmetsp:Transcript_84499/g.217643  ORF Transcript_84499/g.217643 Transcript_84499/m.217643 type:complete len:869 (-) Transcript_84499:160-2766(-)
MASNDPGMEGLNRLEEVILAKVQQRVPARMSEETYLVKAFRYHDLASAGWSDFDKFKRTLVPFTTGVGEQDLRAIYNRYSVDGLVNYKQFVADFIAGTRREPGAQDAEAEAAQEVWMSPEDTLARMRQFLYSQGPRGIAAIANMFREADPSNARTLHLDTFLMAMSEVFNEEACALQDAQLEQLFDCFRSPYQPDQIAYDELMGALREEPSNERRAAIRTAFRRLDASSEGLVDINVMDKSFNVSRHPLVADGSRRAEDVHDEFMETLRDIVSYRRGQRSYPTNLVAWEEFEDYYKFLSGCYDSDASFCVMLQKVWDLDKVQDHTIEARDAMARPAAGIAGKSRAGLHYWQVDTLPGQEAVAQRARASPSIDEVMGRLRAVIARKGIRQAIDVVKNFYAADDDADDEVDRYEFRHACQASSIGLSDAEEACIFQTCGCGPRGAKIQVNHFLQLLHGELSGSRRRVVERAWGALGGNPEDEGSVVSPVTLKEVFAAEAHPSAAKGEVNPGLILGEFLDTFSSLAHLRGGCKNGTVAFSDFLDYYTVLSSTVEQDAMFDLLLNRLWPAPFEQEGPAAAPLSARRSTLPVYEAPLSPMSRGRPPAHDGPSAYSRAGPAQQGQTYRRFARPDAGGYPAEAPAAPNSAAPAAPVVGYSAITKSSIVFNEKESDELGSVLERLRDSLGKRGLKGWKNLAQRFQQYDNRRNGTIMRLDWERLQKSMGLGLSPDERDALYKGLSMNRKDAAMDYWQCLRLTHGPLSEPRRDAVRRLFEELQDEASGTISADDFKACFEAKTAPAVLLGRRDAASEAQDFAEAVDFFGTAPGGFGEQAFMEFFSLVSAIYPDDNEFRLMTTTAFGLKGGAPGSLGGC